MHSRTALLLAVLAASLAVAAPTTTAAASEAERLSAADASADASALRKALAAHLRGPHFAFWLDPRHYSTDRLVIQARRLYYLSALARHDNPLSCEGDFGAARRAGLASAADAGFLEMSRLFRQPPPAGGWRFFLRPSGQWPQQVASYGQAFALYGLSTYAAAGLTHAADARALAHATFDELAARTGPDGAVGLETYAPDFAGRLPGGPDASAVGLDGARGLGTHLHLLEALIAYRRLFLSDAAAATAATAATAAKMKATTTATAAAAATTTTNSTTMATAAATAADDSPFGWTPERAAASVAALAKAARLLLSMRQGGLVLELRDARDARLPAPFAVAQATGRQGYLPGHGVQACFQLWDAAEVLSDEREGGTAGAGAPLLLPRKSVLEFAEAILDGSLEYEEALQSSSPSSSDGGEGAAATYSFLPHIYRLDRSWQLGRALEQAAARLSSALGGWGKAARLPPPPPRSALSVGRKGWESEINWWTQMEHMLALLRTAKELPADGGDGGAKRRAYVERAARAWALLSEKFADPVTGAFHTTVDRSAAMRSDGPTSGPWKSSYHSTRAMLNGIRSLC